MNLASQEIHWFLLLALTVTGSLAVCRQAFAPGE